MGHGEKLTPYLRLENPKRGFGQVRSVGESSVWQPLYVAFFLSLIILLFCAESRRRGRREEARSEERRARSERRRGRQEQEAEDRAEERAELMTRAIETSEGPRETELPATVGGKQYGGSDARSHRHDRKDPVAGQATQCRHSNTDEVRGKQGERAEDRAVTERRDNTQTLRASGAKKRQSDKGAKARQNHARAESLARKKQRHRRSTGKTTQRARDDQRTPTLAEQKTQRYKATRDDYDERMIPTKDTEEEERSEKPGTAERRAGEQESS